MDIQKSQRLSQYLSVVSDMVHYLDIQNAMVRSGMISEIEAFNFERRLQVEDNATVMNELLTIVNLRRGGFDAFLSALRDADYVWIAEQLDPGKKYTGSISDSTATNNGNRNSFQSLMAKLSQRVNRKSEPTILSSHDDIVYASYRDDCPMDIPINPSFYNIIKAPPTISSPTSNSSVPPFLSSSSTLQNRISSEHTEALGMLKSLTLESSQNTTDVVIHNILPQLIETEEVEYFQNLGKRAKIPPPVLQDLKLISKKGISKFKTSSKNRAKVKLRLNSETARDIFVEHLKDYINNLTPADISYPTVKQIKVTIPKNTGGIRKLKIKRPNKKMYKIAPDSTNNDISKDLPKPSFIERKSSWLHKSFRLNWKKTL